MSSHIRCPSPLPLTEAEAVRAHRLLLLRTLTLFTRFNFPALGSSL